MSLMMVIPLKVTTQGSRLVTAIGMVKLTLTARRELLHRSTCRAQRLRLTALYEASQTAPSTFVTTMKTNLASSCTSNTITALT